MVLLRVCSSILHNHSPIIKLASSKLASASNIRSKYASVRSESNRGANPRSLGGARSEAARLWLTAPRRSRTPSTPPVTVGCHDRVVSW